MVAKVPIRQPEHQPVAERSEEHTSELQSRLHLVCRLLLEKKNTYAFSLSIFFQIGNYLTHSADLELLLAQRATGPWVELSDFDVGVLHAQRYLLFLLVPAL